MFCVQGPRDKELKMGVSCSLKVLCKKKKMKVQVFVFGEEMVRNDAKLCQMLLISSLDKFE